ncbi:3-oxoacyl-acyl carrier protein reductase [Emydomyces testavorans]|uniref:3-oxoacyl-acyl carrier protein reductase n=1 Tax=Emydomyces testavorans TaxID=2070801 RepID=A0AAF0DE67_9EURO|nr:3-oxoacyl-acyl carrier protein reductase [Emydomyces testavorans]
MFAKKGNSPTSYFQRHIDQIRLRRNYLFSQGDKHIVVSIAIEIMAQIGQREGQTSWVQHAPYCARNTSGTSRNHKFEAIVGSESNELGRVRLIEHLTFEGAREKGAWGSDKRGVGYKRERGLWAEREERERKHQQLRAAALKATQPGAYIQSLAPNCRIQRLSFCRGLTNDSSPHSGSSPNRGRLERTTCMITGGSSGIGFAIAQRMLHEGAEKVILVGRSEERLNNAARRLGQSIPPRLVEKQAKSEPEEAVVVAVKGPERKAPTTESSGWGSFGVKRAKTRLESGSSFGEKTSLINPSANVSQPPSAPGTVSVDDRLSLMVGDVGSPSFWSEDAKTAMDQVNILVNAAGVSYSSLLPFAKDEAISEMLNTNLQGTILACRAMTSRLLRRPPSSDNGILNCIINISSLHAVKGGIGAATYASTKAGVIALTRAIAAEASTSRQGAKLRANVVVPGYIETKMLDELSPQVREEARLSVPLQRFGTCEEVADAVLFLATNQYANNCVLNIDGGLSAL